LLRFKNNPLACEGIIGDGCGGGRWFFVEDEMLKVYDPTTKDIRVLLFDIKDALSVTKSGCVVSVECKNGIKKLDLSTLK
jgi:hypothetical protein